MISKKTQGGYVIYKSEMDEGMYIKQNNRYIDAGTGYFVSKRERSIYQTIYTSKGYQYDIVNAIYNVDKSAILGFDENYIAIQTRSSFTKSYKGERFSLGWSYLFHGSPQIFLEHKYSNIETLQKRNYELFSWDIFYQIFNSLALVDKDELLNRPKPKPKSGYIAKAQGKDKSTKKIIYIRIYGMIKKFQLYFDNGMMDRVAHIEDRYPGISIFSCIDDETIRDKLNEYLDKSYGDMVGFINYISM